MINWRALLLTTEIPEALARGVHTGVLITDNGTRYAPNQLERWLQEQIEASGRALDVKMCWLSANASWLDQIEIWLSILRGKRPQPNHLERWGKLTQAIVDFIAHSNEAVKPTQWSCAVLKLGQRRGED